MKQKVKFVAFTLMILMVLLSSCQKETPVIITDEPISLTATPAEVTITLQNIREVLQVPDGITISEIQGAGHRSPFVSKVVNNVFGIVTAKRGDGFYMQDPVGDGDPATSEGILVIIRGFPKMNVGDAILVKSGEVKEFNPGGDGSTSLTITQILSSDYEILGSNYPVPDATVIGNGGRIPPTKVIDDDVRGSVATSGSFDIDTDGIDFYESLESMFVQVNNAIAISPTTKYKELSILGDFGENASVLTARGGILLQKDDFNPERIIIDDGLRNIPYAIVGDQFTESVIGVLDYTFGNFKLQTIQKLELVSGGLTPEVSTLIAGENEIAVASYNVENLDALDDPIRMELLADHIVNALNAPDIIGLEEIMDNDGDIDSENVSANRTYQAIIDAVSAIGGPKYQFANIDPLRNSDGGAPGGNIRVGFLYRTDRGLKLVDAPTGDARTAVETLDNNNEPTLSLNPGRVDPQNRNFIDSRKPVTAQFIFNGRSIFVVVCHLNSKGGDDPLYGGFLPPFEISAQQRTGQAKVINAFVKEILAVDPLANVVVMGDMNDFPWSQSMQALQKDVLNNLVLTLPLEEQYSYIFDGNSQALDQIFVSGNLLTNLVGVDVVHVNAEFFYQDHLSDHDPVLAVFKVN